MIEHRGQCAAAWWPLLGDALVIRCHPPGGEKESVAHEENEQLHVLLDGELFCVDDRNLAASASNDVRVIIELYRNHGLEFIKRIDGPYAFALWDGNRRRLILARDRVGAKPLFYARKKDTIAFASEAKAILSAGTFSNSIDLIALNYFLSYGYLPAPFTLFESIKQVKPGHMLIFEDSSQTEICYWKFTYKNNDKVKADSDYVQEFVLHLVQHC